MISNYWLGLKYTQNTPVLVFHDMQVNIHTCVLVRNQRIPEKRPSLNIPDWKSSCYLY